MPVYISLDLETTGFDPANDQLIEIAAIKFEGRKIIDKFVTLLNPQIPIPDMVSFVTGISNEDVKDAPDFNSVKHDFLKFLGNHTIIGHNIDFDLTFLKAKGLPITNNQFDTLTLAGIFFPNLPSLSLDTVSRELKIKHDQKHRAFSDSHVCFELFNIFSEKISQIPPNTLKKIKAILPKSNWPLTELFLYTENTASNKTKTEKTAKKPSISKTSALDFKLTKIEDLEQIFSSNTILEKIIPDFEIRPAQQKLTNKILNAFSENFHLLAEAGTGTGKSFSYLLAAATFSSLTNQKIVISTHTNTLQDQLIHKDIPIVQALFPKLKSAVLKGKNRYISKTRFEKFLKQSTFEDHEISSIIKILLWLPDTQTGDLDELNLQNKELTVLEKICELNFSTEKNSDPDFYHQARQKAQVSNLIIVNHALLLQSLKTDSSILPEYDYLIVDEAHQLERVTTEALAIDFTQSRLKKPLDNLLLSISTLTESNLFTANNQNIQQIGTLIENLNLDNLDFFENLRTILDQQGQIQNIYQQFKNIQEEFAKSAEFETIKNSLKNLFEKTNTLQNQLNTSYHDILEKIPKDQLDNFQTQLDSLQKIQSDLAQLAALDITKNIAWIGKTYDENIHLQSTHLIISNFLQEKLYKEKKSIILTSATLTENHSFKFIRSELGLGEEFNELILPSHFSYPDQVKIIIPEDLPEPKNESYIPATLKLIEQIIINNGGRTLALFTAKKDLSKTFHEIAPRLKKSGFNLLAQGITGGRGKILSHFKDEPQACAILGLNTFWEGVDLIGDDLNCLVIQKLPFDPPDEPILSARSKKYSDPFSDFSLPRAILRFKQGFGRLIRSASDTGNVIILDSRLVTKQYGQNFLNSLPSGIKIIQCQSSQLTKNL